MDPQSPIRQRDTTHNSKGKLPLSELVYHGDDSATEDLTSVIFDDENTAEYSEVSWRTPSNDTLSTSRRISVPKSFKTNIHVQELTINKLQYDAIQFVGRDREKETLHASLQHTHQRKELVLIKGYSGVGKSTLANTLEKKVKETETGIFVRGKFDLVHRDEPYSGIADAFSAISRSLNPEQASKVGEELVAELGFEMDLLVGLIPELEEILPPIRRRSGISSEGDDFDATQERWKYAFRVLTRVVSSYFPPTVIVLDDLQWAGVSSLEMIEYLLTDPQNTNSLMIVGCYRSNEVDVDHMLTKKINDLLEKKDKFDFNVTDIEVGNFNVKEVNKVVMAMLSIDDEEVTHGLAEVCFKRTLGNPFFLIEFVTMLEEEDLITFNLGLLKWMWDVKVIEDATMSTANVVSLLQARMKKLPADAQLLLEFAACLGTSFSHSLLRLVWTRHSSSTSASDKDLESLYTLLQDGNFIERRGSDAHRWVHDKVQEAALSMGDASKPSFQFEIGSILYHGLDKDHLEAALFDVVNLINQDKIKRHVQFAELNLRAANKAERISAFSIAAAYAAKGIALLPGDKWKSHRDLSLALYTLGAQMELAAGRKEQMDKYADEVVSRADCSTLEKLPLYYAQSYKLCTMELRYTETIEFCLKVLKELGCKLVPSKTMLPVHAIVSLMKTVRMARKVEKTFYRDLQPMTDAKRKASMLFLNRLFYASYLSKNDFLLILSVTRMVQITLKYGISSVSGPAYASLGLVTAAILQDYDTASFFAETGMTIQKRTNSKYNESITIHTANFAALPWTKPLQACIPSFLEAYNCGAQSGNTSYSMWALSMYHLFVPTQMGKPLTSIEENLSRSIAQMEELQQEDQALYMRMQGQMVLNLMGKSDETVLLKGQLFDSEGWVPATPNHSAVLEYQQLSLFVYFKDFEKGADLALSYGNQFAQNFPAHFLCQSETFLRGMCLFAMARLTNKRKYKYPARHILKTISKWLENGNPNVQHYYCLLSAENAALNRKYKVAEAFYKESIVLAGRTGNLSHAALSNERYSDFLCNVVPDRDEAQYRLDEALKYYRDWGAKAKVEMLLDPLR